MKLFIDGRLAFDCPSHLMINDDELKDEARLGTFL